MRARLLLLLTCALLLCSAVPLLAAQTIYSFPFDEIPPDSPGWTMTGEWEYGPPLGLGGATGAFDPPSSYDPSSAHSGDYVYGYDLSDNGHYENSIASPGYALTTTALDCTGFVNVRLRFWRWLGVEKAEFDHASIQVSNNGTDWSLVWQNPDYTYPPSGTTDSSWTQVEYDISAVADGQPTVYVRWVMGPTDGSWTWCGWNIDDVEILGDPATEILAWIPYADLAWEYPNTLAALDTYYPYYNVTESVALDATTLAAELEGKDVFLVIEQESATPTDLETLGAEFSGVLTEFVEQGGTVIFLGDHPGYHYILMNATGLITSTGETYYYHGESCPVVAPDHPLAFGLGSSVAALDATMAYAVGPEATVVIEGPAGDAVEAVRLLGAGAVIAIGYDYYAYDADAARVIANAVQYPRGTGSILLNQEFNDQYIAQQALDALGYSYTTVDASDFDTYLTTSYWGLVVVDMPANWPSAGYGELVNFLNAGGRAAVSTWRLTSQPGLCAAFGVSAAETFETPQPIYRWLPSHDLFTYPMDVPDLTTWDDAFFADADRLTWVSGSAELAAGFTTSPAGDQIALIIADGIRILNAFLWDEANQDDDSDGVNDCVELVMNEIEFLRPGPRADFSASATQSVTGQALSFTDLSDGSPVAWYWQFGDGETSVEQDPTHAYAGTGTYTVTLTASDPYGQDTVTKTDYITVGDPGVAAFSATPTSGNAPLTVVFTDLSAGDILAWDWDFGDTGSSTDQNPSHPYTTPGVYTVSLTITDWDSGDTETKTDYITVGDPGVAAFSGSPTQGIIGMTTAFADESSGDVTSWTWDFGDTGSSTDENPSHQYDDPGIYDVSLTVTDPYDSDIEAKADYIWVGFLDCGPEYWSFVEVLRCVQADIVQGYPGGYYEPIWEVSRAQMAVFIARALAGGDAAVPDPVPPDAATFDDVSTEHWAWKYVEYAVDKGVVEGYDPVTYGPDGVVTRGQMAVFVARAKGWITIGEDMTTAPELFPDVPAGFWSGTAIEACVDNGVVQGYEIDGLNYYIPEGVVSRDQMAVFVGRAFGLL